MRRMLALCMALGLLAPPGARAEQALLIKPLAEKNVSQLPAGPLFWRVENFRTLDEAKAAMGAWSLVAESSGKIWLFTLGASGAASSAGAMKIAEVGPIPRVPAARYLLRINDVSGPPGSVTPVHSHPGSEAFLVLDGEQTIKEAHGIMRVQAGHADPGHGADQAMQAASSGSSDLHALVMFVVDADRPFSSPAAFPSLPHATSTRAARAACSNGFSCRHRVPCQR
jgi:hypothetical protein